MGIISFTFFVLRAAQPNRGFGEGQRRAAGRNKRTPSIMFAHANVRLWGTMMHRVPRRYDGPFLVLEKAFLPLSLSLHHPPAQYETR